jgi:septal ring factor EnvC (AmiA/AmiB activator)
LHNLEELDEKIKQLEKKQNLSQDEKKELETKKKDYEEKLEDAKNATIKNIQKKLKESELNIVELDDNRN